MDLTEEQWAHVRAHIPEQMRTTPSGGRPWRDPRDVLNGIVWVLRTGAPWADMPRRYPLYQTCHDRFQKWEREGVLDAVLTALAEHLRDVGKIDLSEAFIDGTHAEAKRGVLRFGSLDAAKRPRSWQWQTATAFLSLSGLRVVSAMKRSSSSTHSVIVGVAGGVYLCWWFLVELLLPGCFNPLAGRLVVVGLNLALLGASYVSRWVAERLSALLTAWACLLVGHYFYLLIGNRGDATWWMGAFVTLAAAGMCMETRREVLAFSAVAMVNAIVAAAVEGQLRHSIYVPGLATILLLANITKRSQVIAHAATLQAERADQDARRADELRLQLAAIVESSDDAIIGSGLDGRIRSWNEGAESLYGYSTAEVIGEPVERLLPPDGHENVGALLARLALGEHVAPVELRARNKEGASIDVSARVSPIRDSHGAIVGTSIVARDISDRKRIEEALVRAREAAEATSRELESFSYSVAHDLRAPLRGITGFSQALLEDHAVHLDAEGQKYLRRIQEIAAEMGRLIESLLTLAQVTRAEVRHERVDLSALAHATAERLRASETGRPVEFVIADGVTAYGDATLLGAVLDNLLGNAWKFTRDRASARIEFGSHREDRRVVYFVRDNGAGFDMAYASKLFGVFQRLHSPTEFEGTGVGLATVQRIVHRHGGTVWAEGKVAEGATFFFTLGEGADHATRSVPDTA